MMLARKNRSILVFTISLLILTVIAVPVLGAKERITVSDELLSRLSSGVVFRYWLANPSQAPGLYQEHYRSLDARITTLRTEGHGESEGVRVGNLFNNDNIGFPQNEESVTFCPDQVDTVLGGTNDYRGLLDPEGNFTGWHLSMDGGQSVTNEGLLPSIDGVPSGGDPVVVASRRESGEGEDPNKGGKPEDGCILYGGSLNYDPEDPFGNPSGIGIYRSDPETLASCPGGSDPSCWPTRRLVAQTDPPHFLDKEWFDVGESGESGLVVWAAWADFTLDETAPLGFVSASINAVRCSADLSECTDPILISGEDVDVQFVDVTIAPDGRTYMTWALIEGELELQPQTFTIKLRIAEAGSTEFGPEQIVHVEDLAIPFGGFLHANDFRVATYPKNDVVMMEGGPRVFVVWDACRARLLDSVCEEAEIKLKYSDDDGQSWSDVIVLSQGGDNYFPALSANEAGQVAFAWFTNRFDELFHNRQDVEFLLVDSSSANELVRRRLTEPSNESEADPLLGGFFIGDYIEVASTGRFSYVHYNANYRQIEVLGEGFPIPQQDNYLFRVGETKEDENP